MSDATIANHLTAANANTSKTLNQFALTSDTLQFGLNFTHTLLPKAGLINKIKGREQAMDIDLSCVLFDASLTVTDTVWFKQLRDATMAVRHHGDSLNGKDRGDMAEVDRYIDVETIEIRLSHLPSTVQHLALVVSSYHEHGLRQVSRGHVRFGDDEGNDIYDLDLTRLTHDAPALCMAVLSRHPLAGVAGDADGLQQLGAWYCHLPMMPLSEYRLPEMNEQLVHIVGELNQG